MIGREKLTQKPVPVMINPAAKTKLESIVEQAKINGEPLRTQNGIAEKLIEAEYAKRFGSASEKEV